MQEALNALITFYRIMGLEICDEKAKYYIRKREKGNLF